LQLGFGGAGVGEVGVVFGVGVGYVHGHVDVDYAEVVGDGPVDVGLDSVGHPGIMRFDPIVYRVWNSQELRPATLAAFWADQLKHLRIMYDEQNFLRRI